MRRVLALAPAALLPFYAASGCVGDDPVGATPDASTTDASAADGAQPGAGDAAGGTDASDAGDAGGGDGGDGGATLPVTGGCVLWLAADRGVTLDLGGAVVEWRDGCSSQNHAVATTEYARPTMSTLAGKAAVAFSGTQGLLAAQPQGAPLGAVGMAQTVVVVGAITTADAGATGAGGTYLSLEAGDPKPFSFTGARPGAMFSYVIQSSVLYLFTDGVDATKNVTSNDPLPIKPFVSVVSTYSTATTNLAVRVNGTPLGLVANAALTNPSSTTKGYVVGNRPDVDNRGWNGSLAEVIVYSRALSGAEQAQVEAYAKTKYGF